MVSRLGNQKLAGELLLHGGRCHLVLRRSRYAMLTARTTPTRGFALSCSDEVDHHRHYRYGDEDVSNPLVSC